MAPDSTGQSMAPDSTGHHIAPVFAGFSRVEDRMQSSFHNSCYIESIPDML